MNAPWIVGNIAIAIGLFFWGYGINRDATPGVRDPVLKKGSLVTQLGLLALCAVFAIFGYFTLSVVSIQAAVFCTGLWAGIRK